MKKILIATLVCIISQPATAATQKEGDTVYVCLKHGGSCKANVIRIGSKKIHVQWLETCKLPGSFLGFGDLHKGDTVWIDYRKAKRESHYC